MWGGRRKRSAVAAEARHLGRSVCVCVCGGAQEQAPRAGPKAAGRLGKHQPTQPVAEDVGAGIRKLQHVGVASVESRAGPHVCGHPQGQSDGAGKNDCASSLEADRTDALQRNRQESCSFSG